MDHHFMLVLLLMLLLVHLGLSTVQITYPKNGTGTASTVISENATSGVVDTLTATTDTSGPLLFVLAQQTVEGCFVIKDPTTGEVSVASSAHLDYETVPRHFLTFTVQDGPNFTVGTLVINIGDENDNPPVFDPSLAETPVIIADKSPQGTLLVRAKASDADGTSANNRVVEYRIIAGNRDSTFYANNNGDIRVADGKKVDKTRVRLYDLVVTATDSGSPPLTGSVTIMVGVEGDPSNGATAMCNVTCRLYVLIVIVYSLML